MRFANTFSKFLSNDDGITSVEYGLLAALIGSVLVGVVNALYPEFASGYDSLGSSFKNEATF